MSIDDCTAHMRRVVSEKRYIKKICDEEVEIVHRVIDCSKEKAWWASRRGANPHGNIGEEVVTKHQLPMIARAEPIRAEDMFIVHSGTSIVG